MNVTNASFKGLYSLGYPNSLWLVDFRVEELVKSDHGENEKFIGRHIKSVSSTIIKRQRIVSSRFEPYIDICLHTNMAGFVR